MSKIKPGKYSHFKGEKYEVLGLARHSETLDDMVVYKALYGEGQVWVRPAAMFLEEVCEECPDGTLISPRFTYIGS